MITIKLIAILFIGIVFTLIGLFVYKDKKILGAVFFMVGVFLVYIRFGPLSVCKEKLDAVMEIDSLQVTSIKVYPYNSSKDSLLANISDRKIIDNLCAELAKSTIVPDHRFKSLTTKWKIVIGLKSKEEIFFDIKTKDDVTGLEVYSNLISGWYYGALRSDSFGEEIKKIPLN